MNQSELEYRPVPNIIIVDDINDILQENKQLKEDFKILKTLQMNTNNILNELENWLKELQKEMEDIPADDIQQQVEKDGHLAIVDSILDKIQELKEEYK